MSRLLTYALVATAVLAVVFWVGLAYWVNRDARRRIRSRFLIAVATLVGLVPYIGAVVYRVFRPAETKDDVRSRQAELAAFEAHARGSVLPTCPECSAAVKEEFLVCPVCTTRLHASCSRCDAPLEPLWQMCPYCATPVVADLDLDTALTREVRAVPTLDLVADPAPQVADA